MALTYRRMTIGDLPAAFVVRFSTIENAITRDELESDYGITEESLAAAMERDVRGWLCEEAGRAVGFAMGDRGNGEVQVVALRPDYQGRGIGSRLLATVRDWLFAEGHSEIWLRAYPDPAVRAYGFYRRLGWRATGARISDDEVMVLRKPEEARPVEA